MFAAKTTVRKFSTTASLKKDFIGVAKLPTIHNEPMKNYAAGSKERANLLKKCAEMSSDNKDYKPIEIPVVINGQEIRTGNVREVQQPANHSHTLFKTHLADEKMIQEAIEGSLEARLKWEATPFHHKATVFLKAADLLSTKYRDAANAATMMAQSKTMWQAEIDAAAETIDFWRFNAMYAAKLLGTQQEHHTQHTWNRLEYRGLEGFVAAISPFNFTAIGANLCAAPAQMGNVVLWKPSSEAVLSNYVMFQVMREAGLPDGVIQFLPCDHNAFNKAVFSSPHLAGLHFTGSTGTFNKLWKQIGDNLDTYRAYPRIVGETGGKNFHLLHSSGNVPNFVYHTIRGAFEYSGQKCSATSRAYIPRSLWPEVKQLLVQEMCKIKVGQPNDPTSFLSSVIDRRAYDKITGFIERARANKDNEILVGGTYSDKVGYFVDPTIVVTKNPKSETMVEEIFGPVLSIYVYEDEQYESDVLDLVDKSTPYGLTGSVFARDRYVLENTLYKLRHASGNVYVNDKSTGAVVGNQPFGGARKSGTNDKAGSEYMLNRWVSMRTIKESFTEADTWGYPSVDIKPSDMAGTDL